MRIGMQAMIDYLQRCHDGNKLGSNRIYIYIYMLYILLDYNYIIVYNII